MGRAFIIGIGTAVLGGVVGLITQDANWIIRICGVMGIGSLLITGIVNGTLSGNIYRFWAMENNEDRGKKIDQSMIFFMYAIPNIIVFLITVFSIYA